MHKCLRNQKCGSVSVPSRIWKCFSSVFCITHPHRQGQRGFVVPEKGALGASIVEGRKLKVATVLLNPTAIEGGLVQKDRALRCSIPWS